MKKGKEHSIFLKEMRDRRRQAALERGRKDESARGGGMKRGWVRVRRLLHNWEAKCRRPNNGQAASTDLPAGPYTKRQLVSLLFHEY